MNKAKENLWEKHQPCKFIWGMVVGIVMGFLIIGFLLSVTDKSIVKFPDTEGGETFCYSGLKHCANTYDKRCWINEDEFESFQKNKEWKIIEQFPNNERMVWR